MDYRGHKTCPDLSQSIRLSKMERRQKKSMTQRLLLDRSKNFTDVDFLLDTGNFSRVGQSLAATRKALKKMYNEKKTAEASTLQADAAKGDGYVDFIDGL
jgi:hypothetical protein